MEHIEEAGIHSGDSACSLPPFSLAPGLIAEIERQAIAMARELGVVGLMNIQFAVQGQDVYVLEVNPRASRTVPFVGKATGLPLAKAGALCMVGKTLAEAGVAGARRPRPRLGQGGGLPLHPLPRRGQPARARRCAPPARSWGSTTTSPGPSTRPRRRPGTSCRPAAPASGPSSRCATPTRPGAAEVVRRLLGLGFEVLATGGTAAYLAERGLPSTVVRKVKEGRPSIVDRMKDGDVHFVVNTTDGKREVSDSASIRRETLLKGVPYFTTMTGARGGRGGHGGGPRRARSGSCRCRSTTRSLPKVDRSPRGSLGVERTKRPPGAPRTAAGLFRGGARCPIAFR